MGQDNAARSTRVLEPKGSGSRTNSQNTERLIAYLDSLGAESAESPKPRKRELLLMGIAVVLCWAYLDQGAQNDQLVIEAGLLRGCIAQYAAGERYARPKPEKCAPMVEANHILTMPLAENK